LVISAMTLLAPERPSIGEEFDQLEEVEPGLLIREARRRQRRRRLVAAVMLVLAGGGVYLGVRSPASADRPGSLLARPLHFPSLGPGGRCPVSSGSAASNAYFGGDALGNGPVKVLIANSGDVLHGRPTLGTGDPGWFVLQTLWFAMPGYDGPFLVRGARLGKAAPIAVQPGATAFGPGSGPLIVPAGPTLNSYPEPTGRPSWAGYRTVPGSTWVRSAGCFAWQVDGRGFSEVIVVDALAPGV
jgi:hypothetical protein